MLLTVLTNIIPYIAASIAFPYIENYAYPACIAEFVIVNLNPNWHATFYFINAY